MTADKYISDMQKDTAAAKRLLIRIASNAAKLIDVDRAENNDDAEAYGMEWRGVVLQAHGILESGHGHATRGLAKHYPGMRGGGGGR